MAIYPVVIALSSEGHDVVSNIAYCRIHEDCWGFPLANQAGLIFLVRTLRESGQKQEHACTPLLLPGQ